LVTTPLRKTAKPSQNFEHHGWGQKTKKGEEEVSSEADWLQYCEQFHERNDVARNDAVKGNTALASHDLVVKTTSQDQESSRLKSKTKVEAKTKINITGSHTDGGMRTWATLQTMLTKSTSTTRATQCRWLQTKHIIVGNFYLI
jgi:hypothetical protein